MSKKFNDSVCAIAWTEGKLVLLDQRYLPHEEKYLHLDYVEQVADAITQMVVRGAPAIGITAAYGVVLAARHRYQSEPGNWRRPLEQDLALLAASRPTAVNLFAALKQMRSALSTVTDNLDPEEMLLLQAKAIHDADESANRLMAHYGVEAINAMGEQPRVILTHCNTGALATGGYGTALGVIRALSESGGLDKVYVDETRPWLQGARLTAWELMKEGVPVVVNADSAAAHLMAYGDVAWVIVGADRIAANGDVANKIGTYSLAVLARYHEVKFMVVAPTTTIDLDVPNGQEIPIEERSKEELLRIQGVDIAQAHVPATNPVFDITPAELIDVIVTERGVIYEPDEAAVSGLMSRQALH